MRGCARARGWIVAGEKEIDPRTALDIARHLSRCPACAEERIRFASLDRQIENLADVPVPSGFTDRVMRRVRACGPLLRRAGACLALLIAGAAAAAAARAPWAGADVIPSLRLAWDATWETAVVGFGRAVVFVVAEVFSGRTPALWHAAEPGSPAIRTALPVLYLALLAGLTLAVLLSYATASRHRLAPTVRLRRN